jgi:flagellin-like protein
MMRRNKGVSAVIGVILMVAITVAIAGTVYYYVSTVIDDQGTVMEACGVFLGVVNDNGSCDLLFLSANGSSFTLHDMNGVDLPRLDGFIGRSVICRYEFNSMGGDRFLGMYLDSDYL